MASIISEDRIRFILGRFRDRLWVRPLVACLLTLAAVFVAKLADSTELAKLVPAISPDSIEKLLSLMSSSMLVIATFSVGSMVSAYASASRAATPRSFPLVVADNASQNALSTFVGAFIFSIAALTAFKNDYFETAGLFILLVLTVIAFGIVIFTFVRWVDRLARLGRMASTIEKVEKATAQAFERLRNGPLLGGAPVRSETRGRAVSATSVGYVQHVDIAALQAWAEEADARVVVAALPGTLVAPDRPLAYIATDDQAAADDEKVVEAFQVGSDRLFDDDPRFGLVVLSEIAVRALSPAVNDPGTAIGIIVTMLRLLVQWSEPSTGDRDTPKHDRVEVPEVSVRDMFDDAFTAIAREGAGAVEVAVKLQEALRSLASIGDEATRDAAEHHARLALKRARRALDLEEDVEAVEDAASFAEAGAAGRRSDDDP